MPMVACRISINNSRVLHLGISDHSLAYECRKIALSKNPPKVVKSRSFKHKSPAFKNDLYEHLSTCDWQLNDPNVLWNQFRNTVYLIM